jgi:nucleoside-diphosphate-sugar epimerase
VPGVRAIRADRRDAAALAAALAVVRPDAVVDTRAMTRADAETTLAALATTRAPVVVLSSHDVYAQFGRLNGLPAPAPEDVVTEDSPLTIPFPFRSVADHPGGPDYDKKLVEAAFRDHAPAATILRLPATYGPRDPRRRFGALVDALAAGTREFPRADGVAWRCTHAHVADVAHAIVLAAEARADGYHAYNVGEAATPTLGERLEAFAVHMGLPMRWVDASNTLPAGLEWLAPTSNDLVVSSARIRAALGFREVTTPAQRLATTLAWLRERPTPPHAH